MVTSGDMLSVEDMLDVLNIKLIGVVENDRVITIAANKGEPTVLNENCKIGKSFKEIAMRIMGDEIPFETCILNNNTFVATLKKLFISK